MLNFYRHICSRVKNDKINVINVLQRQVNLKPMKTPSLEKTVKGVGNWLCWKLALLVYMLCVSLPIVIFMSCLLFVAIKRESSELLPVIMMVLLHPIATIPIGMFAKLVSHFLSAKLFKNQSKSTTFIILGRIFTYSLNFHLALIAAMIYYLFVLWIFFQNSTNVNFSNKPFDQCLCDILPEYGDECINNETQNSFQNVFLRVPVTSVLISFIFVSFGCHLIHALAFQVPRASIYSVYFENRFRFFSIPTLTNPSPNPIPKQLTIFGSKIL